MATEPGGRSLSGEQNPFLRYRTRLDSYRAVTQGKLSDKRYVELVGQLDAAVAQVDGTGFHITPVIDGSGLFSPARPRVGDVGGDHLDIKVDVDNVGGSHKARHLFGVALHLLVAAEAGEPLPDRLAIASCGNAALGAAVIARAMNRPLDVFVPTWADPPIVARLQDLGAKVNRCERRPDEVGDPAYLRFKEAVAAGVRPFSVQGTDTPTTFDGGRTLGWEIAEQVGEPDSVFVQVGGGALATAVGAALAESRLYPVQAAGCAPLAGAWARLAPDFDFDAAAADPDAYMVAWPDPASLASGIVDDITYDWQPLLAQTRASGGRPVVAPETMIEHAWKLARSATGVAVSPTGTAGLAGLLTHLDAAEQVAEPPGQPEHVVVIFTGVDRG